jgi:tellurite resistance protein
MQTTLTKDTNNWYRWLLTVPPNFYAIAFGLVGLARDWQLAISFYPLPALISTALYLAATIVFLFLCLTVFAKLILQPGILLANLTDPGQSPFNSLLPITGMLLAVGLQSYNDQAAFLLFLFFFACTILLGGWLIAQWIVSGNLNTEKFNSGYLLPTVAGGFLCGDSAARFGLVPLGWAGFGIGIISWFMLDSNLLRRLSSSRTSLPSNLLPTIAIELAPSVVGGNAYFRLAGNAPNIFASMLAGYALIMILLQIRLLPRYAKLSFHSSFWAFTFPWAAAMSDAMIWIHMTHLPSGSVLNSILLAAITLFIGSIGVRSVIAIMQGTFLPA